MTNSPLNAFTVDVEDYFQVSAFERRIRRDDWDGFESRVVNNTRTLLELLARRGVRGTFFLLGWVAKRFGPLVREIEAAGHELASHGYWHRLVYEMTAGEFRQDLRDSRAAIEDAAGAPITAYRAASFSITGRSLWALEILAEEGFTVDSSIFPIRHDRYGMPAAKTELHRVSTASGALWEFPPAVVHKAGVNWPVGGGGYFRLYPLSLTVRALDSINRRGRPFVFYTHPWEIDPAQPRPRGGTALSRWRHRVNLASTQRKLDGLLGRFRFGTLSQAIAAAEPVGCAVPSGRLATGNQQLTTAS